MIAVLSAKCVALSTQNLVITAILKKGSVGRLLTHAALVDQDSLLFDHFMAGTALLHKRLVRIHRSPGCSRRHGPWVGAAPKRSVVEKYRARRGPYWGEKTPMPLPCRIK